MSDIDRRLNLVRAYGADPRRWPQAERGTGGPVFSPELDRALSEAEDLDGWLSMSVSPEPSHDLRRRVLAQAAAVRQAPTRFRRWLTGLAWASGAGWTAAACAGVAFGLVMTSQVTAERQIDAVLYQSALDGVDDTEVLG